MKRKVLLAVLVLAALMSACATPSGPPVVPPPSADVPSMMEWWTQNKIAIEQAVKNSGNPELQAQLSLLEGAWEKVSQAVRNPSLAPVGLGGLVDWIIAARTSIAGEVYRVWTAANSGEAVTVVPMVLPKVLAGCFSYSAQGVVLWVCPTGSDVIYCRNGKCSTGGIKD